MDFDEFKVRYQFLSQMPVGFRIRSCRIIDGHYVYEAYGKDESPKDHTAEPFYYIDRNGNVKNIITASNPNKIFSAKVIWYNKNV